MVKRYGYDMVISFTLRHSFLAALFSYKFHCTVDHKYHHSKIHFEHTLKRNLHFFGSSHLVLLVPNVCILKIKVLRPKNKLRPKKLSTLKYLKVFSGKFLLTRMHHYLTI